MIHATFHCPGQAHNIAAPVEFVGASFAKSIDDD